MAESKKGRGVVKYIGTSGRRGITTEDLHSVGVSDQKIDLWWTRLNRWTLPREDISDAAYNYAIRNDPEFVLIGGAEDEGGRPEGATYATPAESYPQMPPPPDPSETPAAILNLGGAPAQPASAPAAGGTIEGSADGTTSGSGGAGAGASRRS